jgi:NTE family protein
MTIPWALVLGGGGLAGIAWETGVLLALTERGLDVRTAERIVGTSAGATVGAQLGSRTPIAELFARQVDPAKQSRELTPEGISVADLMELWATFATEAAESGDPAQLPLKVGELALNAKTVAESARREIIEGRLPDHDWPADWPLTLTAVDVYSGEVRLFDKDSGVPLVDAVAASCAVPGIWPPVTIGDRRYMDGGVRSATNVDLADGYPRVLLLAPMVDPMAEEQLTALQAHAQVQVITPDDESIGAFGANPLDPEVRAPCAHAGYVQGKGIDLTLGLVGA